MPLRPLGPAIDDFHLAVQRRRDRPGEPVGYRTGFASLDRYGGAVPGGFTLVGGRPGMGKSAALEALAWNTSRDSFRHNQGLVDTQKPRISVLYSLEQSTQTILERQAFRMDTRLDSAAYRSGNFTDEQWEILTQTVERLRLAPLYINDAPTVKVSDIADELREVAREYEIRFVGLDFIQRMKEIQLAGELQFQVIGQIAEGLADISKDVLAGAGPEKVPVPLWAAAQLRKPSGDRGDDARPIMTDLYGSRQLEAAARFIVLLYRQDYYHTSTPGYVPNGEAQFIVEKNNNGPTGVIKLMYDAARTAFWEKEVHG